MSYNRFATPRVYTDLINFNLANGYMTLAGDTTIIQDDGSTAVTFDSGSKESMFDMRPSNYAKIEKENKGFYIQIDTNMGNDKLPESNFLAILNHNFATADAIFKVESDDDVNFGSTTVLSNSSEYSDVINAEQTEANQINPTGDGWTLMTWNTAESNNRYLRITIEDDDSDGNNFIEDVVIGSIMWGEYFDFPHSPDLEISTSIDFDGVNLQRSVSGSTYSNASNLGVPGWHSTQPFQVSSTAAQETYTFNQRFGRIQHSMNFSYLTDTDVFSEDWHESDYDKWFDDLNIHNSFINKVYGQHLPFLFSIDKDSTSPGDYGLYRMTNQPSFKQVANRVWNTSLNIIEEY